MDFGDIMDQWEDERKREAARAKAAPAGDKRPPAAPGAKRAPGKPAPPDARRSQEAWMERYGVPDADHREGQAGGTPRALMSRSEIDRIPVDGSVDLHGMTSAEAEVALDLFFGRAEASGWRKVLIIHGKGLHSPGGAVLGTVVRLWLQRRPSAGRSGAAGAGQGGSGVTWVLLKGRDQRSR